MLRDIALSIDQYIDFTSLSESTVALSIGNQENFYPHFIFPGDFFGEKSTECLLLSKSGTCKFVKTRDFSYAIYDVEMPFGNMGSEIISGDVLLKFCVSERSNKDALILMNSDGLLTVFELDWIERNSNIHAKPLCHMNLESTFGIVKAMKHYSGARFVFVFTDLTYWLYCFDPYLSIFVLCESISVEGGTVQSVDSLFGQYALWGTSSGSIVVKEYILAEHMIRVDGDNTLSERYIQIFETQNAAGLQMDSSSRRGSVTKMVSDSQSLFQFPNTSKKESSKLESSGVLCCIRNIAAAIGEEPPLPYNPSFVGPVFVSSLSDSNQRGKDERLQFAACWTDGRVCICYINTEGPRISWKTMKTIHTTHNFFTVSCFPFEGTRDEINDSVHDQYIVATAWSGHTLLFSLNGLLTVNPTEHHISKAQSYCFELGSAFRNSSHRVKNSLVDGFCIAFGSKMTTQRGGYSFVYKRTIGDICFVSGVEKEILTIAPVLIPVIPFPMSSLKLAQNIALYLQQPQLIIKKPTIETEICDEANKPFAIEEFDTTSGYCDGLTLISTLMEISNEDLLKLLHNLP